jgi:glycosyltransferase involved in cell wall biosynthesis
VEVAEKYTLPWLAGMLRTRRLPGVGIRPTVVGLSCERMDENVLAYVTRSQAGRRFCTLYMKWIYFPSFDHHITVSEHVAGELIDASHGHKVPRGIWILPMGVDCERFGHARPDPEVRREMMGGSTAPEGATLLLYAGRLAPEKNLPLLLDTMSLLDRSQYRLAIAGVGILRDYLQTEFERRGLNNVVFLDHIADRDRLARAYASADIFLHPNPREPFGIAPLEAMAAGLALVAPNSGGVNSYADENNAWLTPANGEAFAAAVRRIRSHPEEAASRRSAARLKAQQYAWPVVTNRFLDLYGELHALTQGEQTRAPIAPHSWSTPGDIFGREIGVSG